MRGWFINPRDHAAFMVKCEKEFPELRRLPHLSRSLGFPRV